MPVTLMRHAHTEWNDSPKIFQGYFDVYLSEKGKQETLLKSNSMSDFEFVYSSTASRCIETVNILLGATEKIILDDRLLEIDTGEFTGKTNDEVVWESLKLSSSDKFVSNLPDGLDTVIGNGGVGLSGGQIKRIDLARVIASGSLILLDEHTSSLDVHSERKVHLVVKTIHQELSATIIIVSHQLSIVSDADKIIVVQDGKIAAIGTHQELLNINNWYAGAWEVQKDRFSS